MASRRWTDDELRRALPLAGSKRELCRALGLNTQSSVPFILRRAAELGLDVSSLDTAHPRAPRGVASKTTDDELAALVQTSSTISEVMRRAGYRLGGGGHAAVSHRIRRLGLDTSHFLGAQASLGVAPANRKSADQILVRLPSDSFRQNGRQLRRAVLEVGVAERCADCEIGPEWNGKPLTLQIEHIDGDRLNCLRENLCFLCPNCHAQTESWGRRPGDGAWSQCATVPPC